MAVQVVADGELTESYWFVSIAENIVRMNQENITRSHSQEQRKQQETKMIKQTEQEILKQIGTLKEQVKKDSTTEELVELEKKIELVESSYIALNKSEGDD